jgi:membrane protein
MLHAARPDDEPLATHSDPSHLSVRGWCAVCVRLRKDVATKGLDQFASGTAYYSFLTIPSGLSALIALCGLTYDNAPIGMILAVLPAEAARVAGEQIALLNAQPRKLLYASFLISMAVALWSASSAARLMMKGLDAVYGERESRGFWKHYAMSFVISVGGLLFVALALVLIAVVPGTIAWLPLSGTSKALAMALRWPALIALFTVSLAIFFRVAPYRRTPPWRWVSWGAALALLVWMVASALLSLYTSHIFLLERVYGSLAGVVLLMMWLYVSAYSVLIGAELNAQLERQFTEAGGGASR